MREEDLQQTPKHKEATTITTYLEKDSDHCDSQEEPQLQSQHLNDRKLNDHTSLREEHTAANGNERAQLPVCCLGGNNIEPTMQTMRRGYGLTTHKSVQEKRRG